MKIAIQIKDLPSALMRYLSRPVNERDLENYLLTDPTYPSLFSACKTLEKYGVRIEAYKSVQFDNIKNAISPFLVGIQHNKVTKFILIEKIENNRAYTITANNNKRVFNLDEIEEAFNGIVLLFTNLAPQSKKKYISYLSNQLQNQKNSIIIGLLYLIILSYHISSFNNIGLAEALNICLFNVQIIGIFISILLLLKKLNINNNFLRRVCSVGKTNCNELLNSHLFWGSISLSDLCILYFSSSLIFWELIQLSSIAHINTLFLLSIFALPFSLYSIIYQIAKRKWCILCCGIIATLYAKFALLYFLYDPNIALTNIASHVLYIYLFSITSLLYILIYPTIKKSALLTTTTKELMRIRKDKGLFEQIINTTPAIKTPSRTIKFGNRSSKDTITVVSNPYCKPCSRLHLLIDNWLNVKDKLNIELIFFADKNGIDIATHFITLYLAKQNNIREILYKWYNEEYQTAADFLRNNPANDSEEAKKIIKEHISWCKSIHLTYTPTVLINGRKIPSFYSFDDIMYNI